MYHYFEFLNCWENNTLVEMVVGVVYMVSYTLCGIDSWNNVFCGNVTFVCMQETSLLFREIIFSKDGINFFLWYLYPKFHTKDSNFKEYKFPIWLPAWVFCCLLQNVQMKMYSGTNKSPRAMIPEIFLPPYSIHSGLYYSATIALLFVKCL